jgi:hypothetical protein
MKELSQDQAPNFAALGAAVATVGVFPAAAAVALVYGFPVPFAGKLGGIAAIVPAMLAVVFYGVIGGFLVVPPLGALAGFVAGRVNAGNAEGAKRATVIASLAVSLACAVLLAILDLIIGPW